MSAKQSYWQPKSNGKQIKVDKVKSFWLKTKRELLKIDASCLITFNLIDKKIFLSFIDFYWHPRLF